MPLTPGTRLGVYEFSAAIGQGGMGQVWRAVDTTLGRQVAIKILPEGFAADPERLARFEREAKVLASLNHPHIAALYGFEKSGGMHALVMELVEGEDLSVRIARGPIPLDEALGIARQIAYALEAAHDQGIVHRDLKPANIKVRSDGTVKVLDFGLAKATDLTHSSGLSPDVEMSPTITMTKAGVVLGTAAYMSPEQARGKSVGKRADIWAFGVVLFEMLTGRRPFEGEDSAEILGAVMRLEPPWEALPDDLRPALRTLLHGCLVKDPRQRVADISVALFVIERAASLGVASTPAPAPVIPPARLPWIGALGVALVVMLAMAFPVLQHFREPAAAAPTELRTDIATPVTDGLSSFALSPDGRQIVYVATADGASRLWLRTLTTTTAQALPGTEGASFPFWSPDGKSIAFFTGVALKRVSLDGGAPQILMPVSNGLGGTWNETGVILLAGLGTSVMRVADTGGLVTPVTKLGPTQSGHYAPYFLPDGRRFLFVAGGTADVSGLYLGTLDGGAPVRLTPSEKSAVYLPSGWLMWMRAGSVVAQRLDLESAKLTGELVTVADGGSVDSYAKSAISVSASGLVAYRTGATSQRQLLWIDRTGATRGTLGDPDGAELLNPRIAPDGKRVLVERTVSNRDLWLIDGTNTSRFTFDPASDRVPVWSPDGTRVVFNSSRSGQFDLYVKSATGAGGEELLVASHQTKGASSWSPDGRYLLFHSVDPELTGSDIWVVPMVGEHKPSVFLKTKFNEAYGMFSPDGRWVAYHSNESGQNEIYVRPFVAPGAPGAPAGVEAGAQWQVSTAGGIHPAWRADGKELYFLNPAGAMMAAPITVTGNTLASGTPVVLFPTRIFGGGIASPYGKQYDVTRDGRFLINTVLETAPPPIRLLMNWNPDARK